MERTSKRHGGKCIETKQTEPGHVKGSVSRFFCTRIIWHLQDLRVMYLKCLITTAEKPCLWENGISAVFEFTVPGISVCFSSYICINGEEMEQKWKKNRADDTRDE